MSDKKVFAERLKAKRHEKQMSQAQLARAIQIASSAISNYERGATLPDICIAEKMSRFFGVTIEWLIGAQENFSDKSKNDTESFLSAINSVINISDLDIGNDKEDIAIFVPKKTLLGEYLQNVKFLSDHEEEISDTLKTFIEEHNEKNCLKYSVEELLKESISLKAFL